MSDLKELERLARAAGFILPTYLTTFQSGNGPDVRTFAMLSHDDPDDEVLTGIIDENELSQELSPMLVYISALLNAAPALLKEHKALKARVEELEDFRKQIIRHFPNQDMNHVDFRTHAMRHAEALGDRDE